MRQHGYSGRALLAAAFLLIAADSRAAVLVSDIDDTVKVTHMESLPDAIRRTFSRKKIFRGMVELYEGLLSPASPEEGTLYFVSASPRTVASKAKTRRHLIQSGFPAESRFVFRNVLHPGGSYEHKLRAIEAILARHDPAEPVLLVGDDTEKDPDVYAEIARRYPEREITTYIRRMTGRPLWEGQVPFYTAMDIALRETESGRLAVAGAIRVGEAILEASDPETVMPEFAICPDPDAVPELAGGGGRAPADGLDEIARRVREKILLICYARKEGR